MVKLKALVLLAEGAEEMEFVIAVDVLRRAEVWYRMLWYIYARSHKHKLSFFDFCFLVFHQAGGRLPLLVDCLTQLENTVG